MKRFFIRIFIIFLTPFVITWVVFSRMWNETKHIPSFIVGDIKQEWDSLKKWWNFGKEKT